MVGVIDSFSSGLLGAYDGLLGFFPSNFDIYIQVFILAIFIALVAIFIWYFYKSISRRSLIHLNLNQYNRSENHIGRKILALIFYLLEYIIIMPFIILFWFAALSIVVLVVTNGQSVGQVLLLTAAMVAAIRILSYHKQEVAQDLAKLFPFITFSVLLLTPGALSVNSILSGISQIPSLFSNILQFLAVIFVIEIVLRLLYSIVEFQESEDVHDKLRPLRE